MIYSYKKITLDDIEYLYDVFNTKAYNSIFFEHTTTKNDWIARFDQIKDFIIVFDNNKKIGVINISHKDTLEILLLVINQPLIGKGVGKRIVTDILAMYPHSKQCKVTVKESNTRAYHFYKKMGFKRVTTEVQDLGMHGNHTYIKMVYSR
jgi:N-acetylglutamate synthase-like GNAT family acetyltransferase